MTKPIWVEAAINGPWGKERQPGIPISIPDIVADGIAVVEAGAAIVHLHDLRDLTGPAEVRGWLARQAKGEAL